MKKVVAYFGMCLSVSTALFSMNNTEELVSIEYPQEDPLADLPALVKKRDVRMVQLALREKSFSKDQLDQALIDSKNNENCCNHKMSVMSNHLMGKPALGAQTGFACILLLTKIAPDLTWIEISNRLEKKIEQKVLENILKSNL